MRSQTIIIIGLVITVLFFGTVQHAEAQEIHGFYGLDELFKDSNSIVKLYKSGGFSLKNYELGIAVFGHPVDKSEMFKFTVMVDGKVSRFIIGMEPITPDKVVSESSTPVNSTRIEPKSSIGADITKWDIPAKNPRTLERESGIVAYLPRIDQIMVNDEYAPNIKVENQDYQKTRADVTLKITRDGYTIKSISDTIENGRWNPVINILDDYFTPQFCYTVTLTATSGNYTNTVEDDFIVISTAKYWSSDTNPIDADSKCNN